MQSTQLTEAAVDHRVLRLVARREAEPTAAGAANQLASVSAPGEFAWMYMLSEVSVVF
jgi:hypothetical protein